MPHIVPYNTKIISDFLNQYNLSITAFCKLCKISYATYKKIMAKKNVAINSLIKIINVIPVSANRLLGLEP